MIAAQAERLHLRRIALDDAPFVLDLLNAPSFVFGIGDRGVRTLDDARAYIQTRFLDVYEAYGLGMYAVVLADGTPIGQCGLVKRGDDAPVELGYALLPANEGHGYAREAARAALVHARRLGLTALDAVVLPANGRSVRLLHDLGFERVGETTLPGDDAVLDRYRVGL
ncbi:MAG: GNAT family N-acetyltransferase [Bacteroidetes bacterium]|nr:GNAT family N-acetyltransferase [Bacteroidota bacterium]